MAGGSVTARAASLRRVLLCLLLAQPLAVFPAQAGGELAPGGASNPPAPGAVAEGRDDRGAADRNPLRAVALDALPQTRARPLFAPSRRPPLPKATAKAAASPVRDLGPARPRVALIGTVVGGGVGYGLFKLETTGGVLRLRIGESYDGWVLRTVRRRDAELEHGASGERLLLSAPSAGRTAGTRAP